LSKSKLLQNQSNTSRNEDSYGGEMLERSLLFSCKESEASFNSESEYGMAEIA